MQLDNRQAIGCDERQIYLTVVGPLLFRANILQPNLCALAGHTEPDEWLVGGTILHKVAIRSVQMAALRFASKATAS